jgi:tryptophan synthase beta subunit
MQKQEGRYKGYGGAYMPELLMAPLEELRLKWRELWRDQVFRDRFHKELTEYAGRPTPLTEVPRFANQCGDIRVFLKREDLVHTGAHKLNNAIGQCLLAKELGKTRVIAETGAGQHGVATAAAAARIGLECVIYMGAVDIQRQAPNVKRMKLLGAKIHSVEQGSQTLKEAINEAMREWSSSYETTHYCLGSALGPHPYPEMVREFQSVIGKEVDLQCQKILGRDPDYIVACVGGGSNSIGIFAPFIEKNHVRLVGVEAGGEGISTGKHAARFAGGKPGVLHASYTYLLQDEYGQILSTHSVSAGLDYPAIGPEHVELYENKRAYYTSATDAESVQAMMVLSQLEGIIPALESSHALAYMIKEGNKMPSGTVVVVNLSGRGDKDLDELFAYLKRNEAYDESH